MSSHIFLRAISSYLGELTLMIFKDVEVDKMDDLTKQLAYTQRGNGGKSIYSKSFADYLEVMDVTQVIKFIIPRGSKGIIIKHSLIQTS